MLLLSSRTDWSFRGCSAIKRRKKRNFYHESILGFEKKKNDKSPDCQVRRRTFDRALECLPLYIVEPTMLDTVINVLAVIKNFIRNPMRNFALMISVPNSPLTSAGEAEGDEWTCWSTPFGLIKTSGAALLDESSKWTVGPDTIGDAWVLEGGLKGFASE